MSLITIAIPFYNAENYLELAIKSVLNQTYATWKLLLVDDGSTDSSLKIAYKYAGSDDRIEVFSDGMNKNLGFRLNQIPKLTTTLYLARMDADDLMHPQRIEKQLSILQNNPSIDVLGSNAYSIDEKNNVQGIRISTDFKKPILMKVEGFIHPTIMAKTQWFLDNPYNVKAVRIEDAELWRRSKAKNNFMMTTEPLLFYREFGSKYYKKYFSGLKSIKYLSRVTDDKYWKTQYYKTFLIGLIYYVLNLFGMENLLVDKRSIYITSKEKNEATEILNTISSYERKTL